MFYLANPTTPRVREAMAAGLLGTFETPRQRMLPVPGARWAADTGIYGTGFPGDDEWLSWLARRVAGREDLCLFATAPDVVGDAAATEERSRPFLPVIRDLGVPAAFVAQDGLTVSSVPWDEFDVLFVGGTTDWKLGEVAREIVRAAVRRGVAVHIGRVNTARRLTYASAIGASTVDGTLLAFGPDTNLPRLLSWLRLLDTDPPLFELDQRSNP